MAYLGIYNNNDNNNNKRYFKLWLSGKSMRRKLYEIDTWQHLKDDNYEYRIANFVEFIPLHNREVGLTIEGNGQLPT